MVTVICLVQIEPKNGFETEKVKDRWISTPAPHVSRARMRERHTQRLREQIVMKERETWGPGVETQENKKIFVKLSKKDQNKKSHERWT